MLTPDILSRCMPRAPRAACETWAANRVGKGRRHTDLRETIESWAIPEPNSGCWLWLGALTPSGYGTLNAKKFGISTNRANRIAFMAFNGPMIPDGMQACHKCDNPACVNPNHLWLGTMKENNDDKIRKGRDARGLRQGTHTMPHTRLFGERAKHAKLSAEQVIAIRARPKVPGQAVSISRDYSLNKSTVYAILNGKTWKHLLGDAP